MRVVETTRFRRGKLPHWEVNEGRYFVTIRLGDSLPSEVIARLQEIQSSLSAIEPRSDQFAAAQRQHFLTLEKYLDAGAGCCLLRDPKIATHVVQELERLSE